MTIHEYGDFALEIKDYIIFLMNLYGWAAVEIILGSILFLLCLFERCYDPIFTSKSKSRFRVIGQFGLFIQSLLSMFMVIDGYYIMVYHNFPKIFAIIFMVSAILVKTYLVFLFIEREKNDTFS